MYLRTTTRKNKDGSVVEYYQLAHNTRYPETGKPVANVIHSFGRTDDLDRDHLVRLCRSIARVCGLKVTDPIIGDSDSSSDLSGFPKDFKLIGTQTLETPLVIEQIFFQTANLLNLEVDLIFYDTTTASFSIDYEDSFRAFGHSKEGTWSPRVVVALAVTREGLPVKSWVFPGNTSDVAPIKKIRDDLRGWNSIHIKAEKPRPDGPLIFRHPHDISGISLLQRATISGLTAIRSRNQRSMTASGSLRPMTIP